MPIPHYDPNFVIPATDGIIRHLKAWRDELDNRLATTDYNALPGGSDYYGGDFYASVYGGAAFSQAVTGVMAPLLEGAIAQEFGNIQKLAHLATWRKVHPRWTLDESDFWDPHKLASNGKITHNFVAGTNQLVKALHIQSFLPDQLESVLLAIFSFRNKAMHLGPEWPPDERSKFVSRISKHGWGDWFDWTLSDGAPWIVVVTDAFLESVRSTTHETIRGFDTVREKILTHRAIFGDD